MTVIEALSQQTVPVERRILGRASVLVDLLTEGRVHSSNAVLWGPGVTQSADPPPRYYTADRSDQRSDQRLSLRLILQRLGTCYHWHSIIRRPVSDQLIQQNLDFLPITTCISVIPPTLPSLWCSDTWMPCATLDTLSLRLLLACGEISASLSVSAALKALLQQLTCPGVTQVRSVPGKDW